MLLVTQLSCCCSKEKLPPKAVMKSTETLRSASVFLTQGASDDAVSCAVMLEVLRVMAASPEPLQHAVVFLFNGAEENVLQVRFYCFTYLG